MTAKFQTMNSLKPCGIKNKGNTCFFNAVIQSLLSLPIFISFFNHEKFNSKTQPISYTFFEFIENYKNEKTVDPSRFIRSLKSKIKLFDGKQQDSHCFFELFITLLIEEQGPVPNKLSNIFKIINEDTVKCQDCAYSSIVRNEMNDRYLFIENTVSKSLDGYFNIIDKVSDGNFWLCPNCNKNNQPTIKHSAVETSDIFVIHLQRFEGIGKKNNKEISIDKKIKIAGNNYEIMAIVCHSGSLNSGHYYAIGKRNNVWYELNDSSTTKTDFKFCKKAPYLLFYSKVSS